jgi:hypothetical protein
MRKVLLVLLLPMLFLGLGVFALEIEPSTIDVPTYVRAVALMYAGKSPDKIDFRCTATAFARTPTGFLFVSAAHCVQGKPADVTIYLGDDHADGARYAATVLAEGDQSKLYDFSVLEITAPRAAFTLVPLGHNPRELGEKIYTISSPEGIGREYLEGIVSILDIQSELQVADEGEATPYTWAHNIGFQMLGEGPGSSGSTIACENQQQICMILIGHLPGTMVAEPIERFKQWWLDVQAGKISRTPPALKPAVKPTASIPADPED